jgi:hypothetical protein
MLYLVSSCSVKRDFVKEKFAKKETADNSCETLQATLAIYQLAE